MTTAERLNNQYVQARTKSGAPRLIVAVKGKEHKHLFCPCPKGGSGDCSHIQAVRLLLTEEQAPVGQGMYVPA